MDQPSVSPNPDDPPRDELEPGRVIDGRYALRREIARGGGGVVFEAEHLFTKRAVAVKLLLPGAKPQVRGRLLREAEALTLARHPNVVHALDAGESAAGPYLVLELLEGRALEGILAVRRLAVADAVAVALQLTDALECIHRRGLVHRDVKPANVFIARDDGGREVVKLVDFGSVFFTAPERRITQSGAPVGTPEYMAPEQLLARADVDARSDVYGLAATLYECLAGVVPFEGSYGEVLLKTMTEPLPPLGTRVKGVPDELSRRIEKGLAREPERRFPSALAFGQSLRTLFPNPLPSSLLGFRASALSAAAPISVGALPGVASTARVNPVVAPPIPMENPTQRRRHPRAPYVTPVRVLREGGSALDGRSEDISVGGLLVLVDRPCEREERVKVRFALPISGRVIETPAMARWVQVGRRTRALGLQFAELPADAAAFIERYVGAMGGE